MRIDEIKPGQEYVDAMTGLQSWYSPASGKIGFALINDHGHVIGIRDEKWKAETLRRGICAAGLQETFAPSMQDLLRATKAGS